MTNRIQRREFLSGVARSGAGLVVLSHASAATSYQANEQLGVALVGVSGRGRWFVAEIPKMARVVALCDVNQRRAEGAFQSFPETPKYADFRKMLHEQDRRIDAVVVATPDNTHAVISMAAIQMGKGVYCEKPLAQDVAEAHALRQAAQEKGVATQMGNQGTASNAFRRAVELVRGGLLGEIREVHIWKDSGGPARVNVPQGSEPVPDYLDWNLWLGPAADRPFHPMWLQWHVWRDFASGNLGNWATHSANLAFMALRVDSLWRMDAAAKPRLRIQAKVSEINRVSFPRWEVIRYEIPARGELPPVTFTWHNGSAAPGSRALIEQKMGDVLDWGDHKAKKWEDHAGVLLVGSKGKLHATSHNASFRLLPQDQFRDVSQDVPLELPRSRGHEREWVAACKGGPAPLSNYSYAGPLTEFLMLGNVATRYEANLEFDPLACAILNHDEAHLALRREYRQGWSL